MYKSNGDNKIGFIVDFGNSTADGCGLWPSKGVLALAAVIKT